MMKINGNKILRNVLRHNTGEKGIGNSVIKKQKKTAQISLCGAFVVNERGSFCFGFRY
jgi:hypothetical protein